MLFFVIAFLIFIAILIRILVWVNRRSKSSAVIGGLILGILPDPQTESAIHELQKASEKISESEDDNRDRKPVPDNDRLTCLSSET
jgi:hypothetical protein